jgi:hypothetical protein
MDNSGYGSTSKTEIIEALVTFVPETITAVRQYILSLQSSAALHQVVYIEDVQPSIQLNPIEDPPSNIRFNRYSQFMKKLRKTRL